MITICTNDEVNRDLLIEWMIEEGIPEERTPELCEVYESDIWAAVLRRFWRESDLGDDAETCGIFREWNGGRYYRGGHRSGIVYSESSEDAHEAWEVIAEFLIEELKKLKVEYCPARARIAVWYNNWLTLGWDDGTPNGFATEYQNHKSEVSEDGSIWNANCNCWWEDDRLEDFVQWLVIQGEEL